MQRDGQALFQVELWKMCGNKAKTKNQNKQTNKQKNQTKANKTNKQTNKQYLKKPNGWSCNPSISEFDLVWKEGVYRGNQVKMRSFGRALIQCMKREIWTQRAKMHRGKVTWNTQGGDGHAQELGFYCDFPVTPRKGFRWGRRRAGDGYTWHLWPALWRRGPGPGMESAGEAPVIQERVDCGRD